MLLPRSRHVAALLLVCGLADCGDGNDAAAVRALERDRAALGERSAPARCAAVYPEREAFFGDLQDLDSCTPRGAGHATLCSVWRDEFDSDVAAVYYLRAVENPSCRYSTWQCLGLPADERPDDCEAPALSHTIQERAWSSPLWYGGNDA